MLPAYCLQAYITVKLGLCMTYTIEEEMFLQGLLTEIFIAL